MEGDNVVGSRELREVTEQQRINKGKDVKGGFDIGQRRTSEMRAVHVITNDNERGDLEHANGGVPALGTVGIGAQLLDDLEIA